MTFEFSDEMIYILLIFYKNIYDKYYIYLLIKYIQFKSTLLIISINSFNTFFLYKLFFFYASVFGKFLPISEHFSSNYFRILLNSILKF